MIINQIHSIGDILFLEPMFRYFWKERGARPIVPLRDHLMWMADYIDSANFVKLSTFHWPYKNEMAMSDDYLPLRWANQIIRGYDENDHHDFENMMNDKYILAGLEPDMWRELKLNFKDNRSEKLMIHLGLMEKSGSIVRYVLVNENSQAGNITIKPKTNLQVVKMRDIPGFTVIDWHLVIQMAVENHHVSTSTFYLMQAITNQYHFDSIVFLYPRPNQDGLRGISQLNPTFRYTLM